MNTHSLLLIIKIFTIIAQLHINLAYPKSDFDLGRLDDKLLIRILDNRDVFVHFQFDTTTSIVKETTSGVESYGIFPKSIGQIMKKFGVQEFHLSMTQGRQLSKYGAPLKSAPVGAELYAYFLDSGSSLVDKNQLGFQEALSGIFCASLNQIKTVHTACPIYSFKPNGQFFISQNSKNNVTNSKISLRYGTLPYESVCTENLTPQIKLYPCKNIAGFGQLLNPLKLFDSSYYSMRIDVISECHDSDFIQQKSGNYECKNPKWHLSQSVSSVLKTKKDFRSEILLGTENKIKLYLNEISFKSLFGTESIRLCPISRSSNFFVELPNSFVKNFGKSDFKNMLNISSDKQSKRLYINSLPEKVYENLSFPESQYLLQYDLFKKYSKNKNPEFEFLLNYKQKKQRLKQILQNKISHPSNLNHWVKVHRYLTGEGLLQGGVVIKIENLHDTKHFQILLFEYYPWFIRIYFNTLRIWLNDRLLDFEKDISHFYFSPAKFRSYPSTFEFEKIIPPKSILTVNFRFEKTFLTIDEFPPDYNRGFDIGASVVTIYSQYTKNYTDFDSFDFEKSFVLKNYVSKKCKKSNLTESVDSVFNDSLCTFMYPELITTGGYLNNFIRIYSEQLLVLMPSPDMSMPFNVIAFTSTVLALFFGSFFNLMFKSSKELKQHRKRKDPLSILFQKLKTVKTKILRIKFVRNLMEKLPFSVSSQNKNNKDIKILSKSGKAE